MKDDAILKKLYELRGLKSPESEAYVDDWINTIKTLIAEDSAKSVGFGNGIKAIKIIIASNKKSHPEWNAVVRSSGTDCLALDEACAVKFKGDLGLPATSLQKDTADKIINNIKRWKKECTVTVNTPSRTTLDVIIKDWKATPKKERTLHPVYSFGARQPSVDAQELMNILAIFPSGYCWVSKESGTMSPLYFNWELMEGLLMPLK